jgi:hypothetical protein
MVIALTVSGAALIIAALQDLFHTLFHPSARGDISDWIAHAVWKGFRFALRRAISFAGPTAFVMTVLYWTLSLIFGFAMIYWPHLPDAFTFASGLNPESYRSIEGAINLSLGSLMTLSTGVYPKELWIQLLMGIEAVFGFALLTASVSWILSIYPVLEHRRSLAHEATLLHFSEVEGNRDLDETGDSDLHQLLTGLAGQVITHRNELTQFPITYYFYEEDKETALAGILPYLSDIAKQSLKRDGAAGLAAISLGGAVDDYLKFICSAILHRDFKSREESLQAYADDHMRQIVRSPKLQNRKEA